LEQQLRWQMPHPRLRAGLAGIERYDRAAPGISQGQAEMSLGGEGVHPYHESRAGVRRALRHRRMPNLGPRCTPEA